MAGVAINVALDPPHNDARLTLAVIAEFTVTVIAFEVAVAISKHGIPFDVITTVTASPLDNVELMKVALFVPALVPFTFHW